MHAGGKEKGGKREKCSCPFSYSACVILPPFFMREGGSDRRLDGCRRRNEEGNGDEGSRGGS